VRVRVFVFYFGVECFREDVSPSLVAARGVVLWIESSRARAGLWRPRRLLGRPAREERMGGGGEGVATRERI